MPLVRALLVIIAGLPECCYLCTFV